MKQVQSCLDANNHAMCQIWQRLNSLGNIEKPAVFPDALCLRIEIGRLFPHSNILHGLSINSQERKAAICLTVTLLEVRLHLEGG